jgi:hypothetical protein
LSLGFVLHPVFSASRATQVVFTVAAGAVTLISKRAQLLLDPLASAPPAAFVIWNSLATPLKEFTASVQPAVPPATFQSETVSAE